MKSTAKVNDGSDRVEVKIGYIGGGSRGWAPKLMSDLALCPHLTGCLALYDIDLEAAQANLAVAKSIFDHRDSQTRFEVEAVGSPEQALDQADFVVISIEPGPTAMRYADLEIPMKYGILQPVGDSTGPGGILRALRSVPIYEQYAHQIMAHCPDAWVINYTNPMTICTATLYAAEPSIKAFGCCHEVFSTQERLAELVEKWFGEPKPERSRIELDIAGVNHFTFATDASWNGIDLFPRLREMVAEKEFFSDHTSAALARKQSEFWFANDGLIAYDFFARFHALGAAGDRHLAEFVPWYLTSEEDLHRWGVVLIPYLWRAERMKKRPQRASDTPLAPSGEEGVEQMPALLGIQPFTTNVNLPNRGQIPNLDMGAVVETYAQFSRDRIRPVISHGLPAMLNEHVARITRVQQATMQAALQRDKDLAFQALLSDPLVRIPTDQAWVMFKEMLEYAENFLPKW